MSVDIPPNAIRATIQHWNPKGHGTARAEGNENYYITHGNIRVLKDGQFKILHPRTPPRVGLTIALIPESPHLSNGTFKQQRARVWAILE